MKSYDRICRIDIDDIIKESQGEDIEYIRDEVNYGSICNR